MKVTWISILAVIGASFVSGCNLSHGTTPSASGNSADARDGSGLALGWVSGDGSIQNIPATSAQLFGPEDLLEQGNEISIQKRLSLPNPSAGAALYLVWPESFGGSTIVSATFDLVESRDSQVAKDISNGQAVARDASTGRWFLSLSQIYSGHEAEISPLDRQILTLNFLLADGASVAIQVSFMLEGQIPDHLLTADSANSLSASYDALGLYTFEVSDFANPTDRPLTVWVRAQSLNLTETTWVSRENFAFDRNALQAVGSGSLSYFSQAGLDLAGVEVKETASDGTVKNQFVALNLGQWTPLDLPPSSQLEARFVAKPSAGVASCQLPQPELVQVQGCPLVDTLRNNYCEAATGDLGNNGTPIITVFPLGHWSLTGNQFASVFSRDIRVTESGDQPDAGQASMRPLADSSSPLNGLNTAGNPVPGAGVFTQCAQGIFH